MAGELDTIGADLEEALERIRVPSYVLDANGRVRWLNRAALAVVGDVRGRLFTSLVAEEDTRRSRELFARKMVGGTPATEAEVVVVAPTGERLDCEICAVQLRRGGHVVGVFGQVVHLEAEEHVHRRHAHLTARQHEVLRLLEHGRSTVQIAAELSLSPETVRNHVRHILRAFGVHSRLEAVAAARTDGLAPA
jgi:PAS domain S-box-containing protein